MRGLITTRHGGVSWPPYGSLNLGGHVGDEWSAVVENRRRLAEHLPAAPCWLNQVHGSTVIDAATVTEAMPDADAAVARQPGVVCAVMTADCLPVLLCDRAGNVVAVAHAGWRGLNAGILEQTVRALGVPGPDVLAYFGPAIGPSAFEVGDEVRDAFVATHAEAAAAFLPASASPAASLARVDKRPSSPGGGGSGKWLADIYLLARQALGRYGVTACYGGEYCTLRDETRFFSFRRDHVTGRMASLIWLADD